jgi:hypothetical protein
MRSSACGYARSCACPIGRSRLRHLQLPGSTWPRGTASERLHCHRYGGPAVVGVRVKMEARERPRVPFYRFLRKFGSLLIRSVYSCTSASINSGNLQPNREMTSKPAVSKRLMRSSVSVMSSRAIWRVARRAGRSFWHPTNASSSTYLGCGLPSEPATSHSMLTRMSIGMAT